LITLPANLETPSGFFAYTHTINLSASGPGESVTGKKAFREAENFTTGDGAEFDHDHFVATVD